MQKIEEDNERMKMIEEYRMQTLQEKTQLRQKFL